MTDIGPIVIEQVEAHGGRREHLLDILRGVQSKLGWLSPETIDAIAQHTGLRRVDVQGVASFYHFFAETPQGEVTIHLSDCVSCRMAGAHEVARALETFLGIRMGERTPDGRIGLAWTSCIGLCDHGPAALVNGVPVLQLDPEKARGMVERLQDGASPLELLELPSAAAPAIERVRAMVPPNIRSQGPVVLGQLQVGAALNKALALEPDEVIRQVKDANLCGRGGAGFPTGLKWQFCRSQPGERKVIICNADEGEPGTFKDRVLLAEQPGHVIEGMTIAAWAVGAQQGIIYLRSEYAWLEPLVKAEIERRRSGGQLGKDVGGREGFHFDVEIRMGAGAYVCGEESALIESAEGKRGCPRHRPPFPVQVGYQGLPTVVNNVETFCVATDLMAKGFFSVARLGTGQSRGTKLYSVSGDCARPGVWELPFGLSLRQLLSVVGAEQAIAVQVGGPSGCLVGPSDFDKRLCFEELSTGGSVIVFGPGRDLLQVAAWFMDFFVEESCGWCVPCRAGNTLIKQQLERVMAGHGLAEDLDALEQLCETVRATSRCGLGQTSPNPVLSALKAFRPLFEQRLLPGRDRGRQPGFDLTAALAEAVRVQGREPIFHGEEA
jgi:[NiFe] hydrogenase diaphorase moiety large subunit